MRNWKMRCLYAALALLLGMTARAQGEKKRVIHKLGLDVRPAYIIPSSESLRPAYEGDIPLLAKRRAMSYHLKYGFQLNPESELGRLYPHTTQGVGVSFNTFGSQREVGNPWAAYVFQTSRIAALAPWLSVDYEWNFGASFGWHPYDEDDNFRNRVIGSKINAYLNVNFFLNARLSRYCSLQAGVDLTHYSNGNTHLPNSGLNTVGSKVGLVYTLNPMDEPFYKGGGNAAAEPDLYPAGFWKRVSYDVVLYAATRAKGTLLADNSVHIFPGHFGILGFNVNPMYKFNRFLKAGVSLDGQYDETANIYTKGDILPNGDPAFYRPPLRQQIGVGLSARGEFTMPFFAINLGVGHNLYYNKGSLKGFYQILALKLSITRDLFLHIGYQLHKFHEPNNLMLGVGYRFHNL